MRILFVTSVLLVLLVGCGSDNTSDATAIATAEIGGVAGADSQTTTTPTAAVSDAGATPVATEAASAAVESDPAADVSQAFFDAYQSDPSGDASAVYFTQGMLELYNGGQTVTAITGIDPSYSSATVTNTQLYNDNQNALVTVQLDYANGSQTVDVTLERQNDQWRVAAVAGQPQK